MKKIMTKILVVLLPVMAVALATTTDSVHMVNTITGESMTGSYFELLPAQATRMAAPLSGMSAIASAILAALYLFVEKVGFLQGSKWCGFAGACLAVLPLFVRGETMLIPNVGVPILLMSQFVVCAIARKLPEEETAAGPRLEQH